MNKEEKQLVPELRFPEFKNDKVWSQITLGKIAKFKKGKSISKKDISPDGNQSCIRYGELYTHYKEIIETIISKTKIPKENLVLSKKNDVIIPSSGETREDIATASCVVKDGVALGGDLNIIRTDLNGVFFAYYLNSSKKRAIAEMAQGVSVIHLYNSQLQNLEIEFPNPKEQQKIANCLSSLDEVINAETEKLDVLQNHKKGLLQQLFPQEGETQPKYRFPEFKKDGDWEEKELKKLLEFQTGYPFKSKGFNAENKGIRLIKNRDLKADDRIVFFEGSFDKPYLVNDGDILVGMDGDFSPVKWCKGEALLNQRVGRIRTKNNTDDFFFYFLSIHLKIIEHNTPSTTVKHLSHSTVEKLKIPIPSTVREQQKIANCLSSVDGLIAAQEQKIEDLQKHKKGLLQQLFPKINDVAI